MIRDDLNIIAADAFQGYLFQNYGIPDWEFEWRESIGDDLIGAADETAGFTTCGYTDFSNRTIYMSKSAARSTTEWDVYQTMLHEIAHARVGSPGHGPKWEKIARQMGCEGVFIRTHGEHTYSSFPGLRGRGSRHRSPATRDSGT